MLKLVPPMARRVIICKMKMQKAIAFTEKNQKMTKRIARDTTKMIVLVFFVFITSLFVYHVDIGVVGAVLAAFAAAQPLLTERDERPDGEAGDGEDEGAGAWSSEKSSSKRR